MPVSRALAHPRASIVLDVVYATCQSKTIVSSYNSDLDNFAKSLAQPSSKCAAYTAQHSAHNFPRDLDGSCQVCARAPHRRATHTPVSTLGLQGSEEALVNRGVSVRTLSHACQYMTVLRL